MISLYCWNPGQGAGMWLSEEVLQSKTEKLRNATDIFWIDLENPTPEEENLVFKDFHAIHSLSLEDVTRLHRNPGEPHLPKVEEFPDYLFVIVNPLTAALIDRIREAPEKPVFADSSSFTQLSAVLTQRWLITHHYEPHPAIDFLKGFLSRHEARAERGPDYLFHLILDASINQYAPVIAAFEGLLDRYEDELLDRHRRDMSKALLAVKRDVTTFRKTLVLEREIVAQLAHGEYALIDDREAIYYRNVYDHILRFTELIDGVRETVSDLMNLQHAVASQRLNEVMKVLTMMSTIILPMTLIAGIYGMNFEENMWPHFKEDGWGFAAAIGMMVLSGVASFGFFRWRKWI